MRASESIRFCITMVDYKIHSQKISALATPKKGVIFHVENWCRMKGPPQFLRALELIFALPTHWEPLTVSLTSHLLTTFTLWSD